MTAFIYPPGEKLILDSSQLTFAKSKEILIAIDNHSFCNLIETGKFQDKDTEYVVIELDIERGQFPINPILYKERILIEVKNDVIIPSVYAIRDNFPLLPHLNFTEFDFPRCLCLYEQPPEEIAIHWTGFFFLERIRQWFSFSSSGTLHQEDQPLEPFLLEISGNIILPDNIKDGDSFNIVLASQNNTQCNLKVVNDGDQTSLDYYVMCFESQPQLHGIVNKQPRNLDGLVTLFNKCSIDLIAKIKMIFNDQFLYKRRLIIILSIPTKRTIDGEIEKTERFAFIFSETIEKIGIELNILDQHDGFTALIINSQISTQNLINIEVGILTTYSKFNKKTARLLSGISNEFSITQIGVGALGSGLFNLLSRSGFGKCWTLVDHDVLLPHNLYRHSLLSFQAGDYKSKALSVIANFNIGDYTYSHSIVEMFRLPMSPELQNKIQNSDLIIDTSASLPVSRILSNIDEIKARKISIFLNPRGNDLVILANDTGGKIKLEELEMLYYKAIVDELSLNDHFQNTTNRVRYGNSCRDISNSIANEHCEIFSAISANLIKKIDKENSAFIKIWRLNDDMSVTAYTIQTNDFIKKEINGWFVAINSELVSRIKQRRKNALPNETGGILIGSVDMNTKKIFIVDSIFSPIDSKEYPNAYYRGIDGVLARLSKLNELANGYLNYIGEWHSHPDNSGINQSSDDKKLFTWITNLLNKKGLPGTMLIVGKKDFGIYVK